MKYFVYRLYDDRDHLLYVGATNDPLTRLRAHSARPWGNQIERLEMFPFDNVASALSREEHDITTLRPQHNERSNPDREFRRHGVRLAQVRDILAELGPMTDSEIKHALTERGIDGVRSFVGVSLIRLMDLGEVEVVEERPSKGGRHSTARVYGLTRLAALVAAA